MDTPRALFISDRYNICTLQISKQKLGKNKQKKIHKIVP